MNRVKDEDLRPELGSASPHYSAFLELSTERQFGMSVGPIPMSKVVEYLARYNLPQWWAGVISAADATYLKLITEEAKKANAA